MLVDKKKKHSDAGEGAFFQRELDLMKTKVYEVVYPEIMHATVMPVSADKDPSAATVSYRMFDIVGVAKIISNYADDLPRADVLGREYFLPVHTLGISCGWNYYELLSGMRTNRPIDQSKIKAAKRIILQLCEKLAFLGDSSLGIVGFTNVTNMPNTVVPTAGGATTWLAKQTLGTDAGKNAILNDVNLAFDRQIIATKGLEVPNTVALAPSSYSILSTTPRTDSSDTTLLDFILKAHPGVTFIPVPLMETSGTGGARQLIVYRRDPDKLELEIPQEIFMHEPEHRGLEWVVAMTMRFAGLMVRYPLSMDSSYGM